MSGGGMGYGGMSGGGKGGMGGYGNGMMGGRFGGGYGDPYRKGFGGGMSRFGGDPYGGFGGPRFNFGQPLFPGQGQGNQGPSAPGGSFNFDENTGTYRQPPGQAKPFPQQGTNQYDVQSAKDAMYGVGQQSTFDPSKWTPDVAARYQRYQDEVQRTGSRIGWGGPTPPPPGRGAAAPGGFMNRGRPSVFDQGFSGVGGSGFEGIPGNMGSTPGAGFKGPARMPDVPPENNAISVNPPPPPPTEMAMNPDAFPVNRVSPPPPTKTQPEPVPKQGSLPYVPDGGYGQPGQYAAPLPGGDPSAQLFNTYQYGSADDAYNAALAYSQGPNYENYYNSMAPSTRSFMSKPDRSLAGAQAFADRVRQEWLNNAGRNPWSR